MGQVINVRYEPYVKISSHHLITKLVKNLNLFCDALAYMFTLCWTKDFVRLKLISRPEGTQTL